jgi:membrane protein implicated in regulation of membrane protease activity
MISFFVTIKLYKICSKRGKSMDWWVWALIGFGGLLAELVFPAFVLIWFGLGGLAVMLVALVLPDLGFEAQIFLWVLLSAALTFAWFRFFKKGLPKSLVGQASHLLGEVGLLSEAVAPFKRGKVRFQKPMLGSDQWDCIANEEIAAGTRVKIVSIDGNMIVVTKTEEKTEEK